MSPPELLFLIRGRLAAQKSAKALYAERLAPDFSVFDFLNCSENGLSRIIAWLLDPAGSHAQADKFLRHFVKGLELNDDWLFDTPRARSKTEVSTGAGESLGYIDILVRMGDRALAIENKPFAADQPRQVERYLRFLEASCRQGYCLVYLSGTGDGPSEASISTEKAGKASEAGNLIVRSYASLIPWLEDCQAVNRAANVGLVIDGLTDHIRRDFMGVNDMTEATDLVQTVCTSQDMLEAALALLEADQPIRAHIVERFVQSIDAEVARHDGWHVVRSDLGPERYTGVLIGFSPESPIGFGFQFDRGRFGNFFYGASSKDERPFPADVKETIEALIGSQGATDAWPAWKWVGPNDPYFPLAQQADREFWLAAYDGRLLAMLVRFVEEVESALQGAGLLDKVRAPAR